MATTIDPSVPAQETPPNQVGGQTPSAEPQNWWDLSTETEPQTPAPQTPTDWFLRSEDGSVVYRTKEDAIRGLSERNKAYAQQKGQLETAQKLLEAAGIRVGPQEQTQLGPMLVSLESAIARRDMSFDQALATLIQQAVQQQTQAMLEPLRPILGQTAFSNAVEVASERFDPNISAFVRSPAMKRTLESHGSLKTAIQNATADPKFHGMLPELLQIAHLVAKAATPAATIQRPAPQSLTPPQTFQTGAPVPQGLSQPDSKDPFEQAMAQIPAHLLDLGLTKENLG